MLETLVDEQGRLWPAREQNLHGEVSSHDTVAEAIWTLGHVYLASAGGKLIVAFRPRLVTRLGLIGAFREMCVRYPREVWLSYSPHDAVERLDSVDDAMRRMEHLAAEAQRELPRGLSAQRLPLDWVSRVKGGILGDLLDAWQAASRGWTPELYARLAETGLLGNAVIVRNPKRSDALLIEHWGEKRDLFGRKWIREARGRPVEEQPYPGLAGWAGRLYREAIAGGDARLDAVSVAISTGPRRQRAKRYTRLLLPWRGKNGEAYALTVNIFELPQQ